MRLLLVRHGETAQPRGRYWGHTDAPLSDRGVRQAGFYVLRQNYMPAVLVEVGFLSNASEEKLLRAAQHRDRLAEGISRGIVEYVRRYERRVNGS